MEWNVVTIINIMIMIGMLLFMWSGWRDGFLWKLLSILGFFLVGVLSWWASAPLAELFQLYPKSIGDTSGALLQDMLYDNLNRLAWFVLLFVVLNIIILLLKPLAKFMQRIPVVSLVNRVCGLLLGGVQGMLIMLVCYLLASMLSWSEWPQLAQQSWLRYSEPLCEQLLFYLQEPLEDLKVFQETGSSQTDAAMLEHVEDWIEKNDIEKEQAEELLKALQ